MGDAFEMGPSGAQSAAYRLLSTWPYNQLEQVLQYGGALPERIMTAIYEPTAFQNQNLRRDER
jgi:hypothetical protein